jgi:hypothetical protein
VVTRLILSKNVDIVLEQIKKCDGILFINMSLPDLVYNEIFIKMYLPSLSLCFQYTVLFRVGAGHPVSLAIEATPVDINESSFDTYRSPPRPLPYDDPRFSPPSRDWFALRCEASSHSPEESEPLRADDDVEMETPVTVDKPSKTNYDTKMKRTSSAYREKLPPKEHGNYFTYFSPSDEDEDVCPTCLEGIAY